jgi:hypothetical protein
MGSSGSSERRFGDRHAAALSSDAAALHLALLLAGVAHGDDVLVSTPTITARVNPIRYLGPPPSSSIWSSRRGTWTRPARGGAGAPGP